MRRATCCSHVRRAMPVIKKPAVMKPAAKSVVKKPAAKSVVKKPASKSVVNKPAARSVVMTAAAKTSVADKFFPYDAELHEKHDEYIQVTGWFLHRPFI